MYANGDKSSMSANDDNSRISANGDSTEPQAEAPLPGDEAEMQAAIAELKAFQEAHSLGGLPVRDMIEEGRKR